MHTFLTPTKILTKAAWVGWRNTLKGHPETRRRQLLKGIGYLIFIVALSLLGHSIFKHLRLTEANPALVFNVINGFMMFGVIIVAKELMESSLKILYEAPDGALLRTLPIQPVAIFGFKFVHLTASRLMSILCFLGPPWVVFGVVYALPWHFYAALFPAYLCLLIILASHVTVGMMVIARFFSSGALLSTLKVLGIVIGVTVGFLLSLTLFFQFDSMQIKQYFLNWASAKTAQDGNSLTTTAWFPHQWIGKLMFSWAPEAAAGARLRWGLLLIGGSLGSMLMALLMALLIYSRGWENIRQLQSKRKPIRSSGSKLRAIFPTFGRGKMSAMMLKDFIVFIRHSGRFIAILMLTLFLALHIGVLLAQGRVANAADGKVIAVQVVLYSILISLGLSCGGFREEAKTWWMLKSAPVTPKLVFSSKFLATFLSGLIYAEVWMLITVILLQIPAGVWMQLLLMPIVTLIAVSALNTAVGTLPWMANLVDEPKPLLRGLTFLFTIIVDIGLVIVSMIAFDLSSIAWFVGLLVLLSGVFAISYRWGTNNLHKLLAAQA